tara:strand:+ start:9723 stop:10226 length:504 start_codon:yes stop_codon:yes gene_type:complete
METEIEDSWIKNFKEQEFIKKYEDTIHISIFFIYINRRNELHIIKQGPTYILQSNQFEKQDLIDNIKKNSFVNNQKYKLLSILKYNVDVDANNLEDFLFKDNYDKYTETIKSLDTILFSNSTKMFNDINSLFILYHENIKPCYTKKIKINTKSNRKTKSKRYKEIKK